MKAAADHVRHLIDQGDALAARDDMRSALSFYRAALKAARDEGAIPAVLVPELKRVLEISQAQAVNYEAHLQDCLRSAGYHPQTSSDRFTLSLDLMAGRKRLFFQEPRFYLFPGLPQIEFEARERVPWLAEVEAAGPAIRGELQALIADQAVFKPYVESRGNRPNGDQGGMLDNPDWSAIFLWKDGVEQPDVASRCPQTLRALGAVPLCKIPGRTPSILFSKLSAGARIPKHHGMVNVRLICHLPLITPQGCHLRVGNTVREWRDGEAWAFDDTVEHEARNDSDEDRVILIFDVWKDEVSDEERSLIASLFNAIDTYDTPSAAWGV
jgi:hypothetical protein